VPSFEGTLTAVVDPVACGRLTGALLLGLALTLYPVGVTFLDAGLFQGAVFDRQHRGVIADHRVFEAAVDDLLFQRRTLSLRADLCHILVNVSQGPEPLQFRIVVVDLRQLGAG